MPGDLSSCWLAALGLADLLAVGFSLPRFAKKCQFSNTGRVLACDCCLFIGVLGRVDGRGHFAPILACEISGLYLYTRPGTVTAPKNVPSPDIRSPAPVAFTGHIYRSRLPVLITGPIPGPA